MIMPTARAPLTFSCRVMSYPRVEGRPRQAISFVSYRASYTSAAIDEYSLDPPDVRAARPKVEIAQQHHLREERQEQHHGIGDPIGPQFLPGAFLPRVISRTQEVTPTADQSR